MSSKHFKFHSVDVAKWIGSVGARRGSNGKFARSVLKKAGDEGRLFVLKWIRYSGAWNSKGDEREGAPKAVASFAASNGRVHVLQWLKSEGLLVESEPVKHWTTLAHLAANHGHLGVLQWLHKLGALSAKDESIRLALFGCHLHILQWFYAVGLLDVQSLDFKGGRNVAHEAARLGSLKILEWLHSAGLLDLQRKDRYLLHSVPQIAARSGQLHILQWIHANFSKTVYAVEKNDITKEKDVKGRNLAQLAVHRSDILRWLHECSWLGATERDLRGWQLCHLLSFYVRLDGLQWLHSVGLLDARAVIVNANTYLLRHYSGWNISHLAAHKGSVATLSWLFDENLLDVSARTLEGFDISHIASKSRHLYILKWMHSKGLIDARSTDVRRGAFLLRCAPSIALD